MTKAKTDGEALSEAVEDLLQFVSLTASVVAAWEAGDLAAEVNRLREFAESVEARLLSVS